MRKILLSTIGLIVMLSTYGQQAFFTDAGQNVTVASRGKREIIPQKFRTSTLDLGALTTFLKTLPFESPAMNRSAAPVLTLPMPDGSFARFHVWESPIMEPGLQQKFPDIRTYTGQGIDDRTATIRFDINPYTGFHAQILSGEHGRIFIDPFAKGDLKNYISYRSSDYTRDAQHVCLVEDEAKPHKHRENAPQAVCLGGTLRTYRLAVSCTGEYAVAVCAPNPPTVAATLAAIVVSMNRVNGVYEKEIAIRMNLIANNDQLIFLDGSTDPFTNNNGTVMLGQNQTTIDNIIGNANYDIGHVFSTGGGGIASLRSPCQPGQKARGVTGQPNPIGDGFDIDYVAHEMGHQWGANHTMAGCGASPNNTKLEPGSGTTIMAYAGICGAENIQPNSDAYFHGMSIDEMSDFVTAGGDCGVNTATGNTAPVINPLPLNGVSIPVGTPFTLTATATDADGDALTYCWEQFDFSGTGNTPWNAGANGAINNTIPLFRSRNPRNNGTRSFPDIRVILAGFPANPPSAMDGLKGETLSPVARPMKFRLTVRDNRAGGGAAVSSGTLACQNNTVFQINVVGTTPFTVAVPNGGESYPGGSQQTFTWNVAGTNAAPINTANVRITLSTDGGLTYPVVVVASTPNDGSELVTIPSVPATGTARVRVEAVGNVFYDISNANFSITQPVSGFDFGSPSPVTSACPAPASLSATLSTSSSNGFSNTITLTATGNPAGTTVSFLPSDQVVPGNDVTVRLNNTNTLTPGTYTVEVRGVASGAPDRTRTISFVVNPGAGPTVSESPASQVICEGANVTFTAAATGATSQQWQVSTNGGSTFTNIAGATGSSFTITNAQFTLNDNRYRCVFTGQCGTTTGTAAVLTVQRATALTAQPQAISLCTGTNGSFAVTAIGNNLTYQWQLSTDGGSTFTNIAGTNTSSITVAATNVNQNNHRYRCIVTGICGAPVTSAAAVLTVNAPISISFQPSNETFCGTGTATFGVVAAGTPINYQWQVSTDGGNTFSNLTGANAFSLSVPNVTTAQNGNRYRVVLSNAACPSVTSSAAVLTVNPIPVVSLSAAPYTALFPGLVTTVSAAVTPASGVSLVWRRNGIVIPVTGNGLTVNLDQLGTYTVTATGPGGCTSISNSLAITDSATNRIFFYPNPNNGIFQVRYNNPQNAGTTNVIRIFDGKGAKVFERQFSVSRPYDQMLIDLRARGTGIYFVELLDAQGKRLETGKVLVQ